MGSTSCPPTQTVVVDLCQVYFVCHVVKHTAGDSGVGYASDAVGGNTNVPITMDSLARPLEPSIHSSHSDSGAFIAVDTAAECLSSPCAYEKVHCLPTHDPCAQEASQHLQYPHKVDFLDAWRSKWAQPSHGTTWHQDHRCNAQALYCPN